MTSLPQRTEYPAAENVEAKQHCFDYELDKCRHGERCERYHAPEVNTSLRDSRPPDQDWDFPNEPGKACVRCVQALRPCDKEGRSGEDNPCSECRWFGGETGICILAQDTTYNDQAFKQMLQRRERGYTLAAPKDRSAPRSRGFPLPIPGWKVKPDWQGETREQLLAKDDMVPPYARQRPRAHLVLPRRTKTEIKSEEYKRKLNAKDDAAEAMASTAHSAPRLSNPPLDSHMAQQGQYTAQQSQYFASQVHYGAPSNQYMQPQNQYGPPQNQYMPPQHLYGPPPNQYMPPQSQYGLPSNQYMPPQTQNMGHSNQYIPPSDGPQYPPRPEFIPPAHPQYGHVVEMAWLPREDRWRYTYYTGDQSSSPIMRSQFYGNPPAPSLPPRGAYGTQPSYGQPAKRQRFE